jgi:tetratricopeptide (TPR) repeat protein
MLILAGCASDNSYDFTPDPQEARSFKEADAHDQKGVGLLEKGELDQAIQEFSEAIRIRPRDALAYYDRGVASLAKGKPGEAVPDFDVAIQLNPNDSEACEYRGIAHSLAGKFKEAVSDFKQALEINPNDAFAYSCLAALRSTCKDDGIRDAAEAVQAATKACELTDWKVALHIHRLAAAYAESGDWEKAVSYEEQAITVGAATPEEHNRMVINLSLYKSQHPFRDPTIFE